jgi:hypothetical protein
LSRNKGRVGDIAQKPEDTNPPPQVLQQQENSGFSFVVPTEFVDLPSQGRYYPEGHPLHNQESIEIKQMTAKEEDMLTSRTLLKKGIALDRVVQSLIVDKTINVDSLLIGDKNALIIATRVSGYGNEYKTKVTCPACASTDEYNFDLNDSVVYRGEDMHILSITDNQDGTFDVVLPKLKTNVTFRLLIGADEKNLLTNKASRNVGFEKLITTQLSRILLAINGDDSRDTIEYVVDNMPSIDSRHLRACYRAAAPNIDLTQTFVCEECGHDEEMEVPLTADFFWPDR